MAGSVGALIGTGQGRGIGLMFIVTGLRTFLLGIVGYALPRVRHLETELPDYIEDEDAGVERRMESPVTSHQSENPVQAGD